LWCIAVRLPDREVIGVHIAILNEIHWIGVDLNTTGHVAVAADPKSGKIVKLGKNMHNVHHHAVKNCTKLLKEDKLWKIKKNKSKDRKQFKTALATIARQIVSFADSLDSGIKFEQLFSAGYSFHESPRSPYEFSVGNGSFFTLQKMVERRAHNKGIPVIYVNPAYTSKRCCRCGEFGRRHSKHFECPNCGFAGHADVNAAFNIATSPLRMADQENVVTILAENFQQSGKAKMRRMLSGEPSALRVEPYQQHTTSRICENVLTVLN